jgi:hypothetical protein
MTYENQARQITNDEANDMGNNELQRIIEKGGLTAGVLHIVGLAEALNAQLKKSWGTGSAIREMPIGSYLRSIGQNIKEPFNFDDDLTLNRY